MTALFVWLLKRKLRSNRFYSWMHMTGLHYQVYFSLTPGQCRIVYLDEIPVEGLTIADISAAERKSLWILWKIN